MTDTVLQARIADLPRNTILLLEDIDAAFVSRDTSLTVRTAHGGQSQVTLTGLLNALDGVVASEARLTFFTTNYPQRLDPALVRPGRVDLRLKIGHCNEDQIQRLFRNFFTEATQEEAEIFGRKVLLHKRDQTLSAAQIQSFLLVYKDDLAGAIRNSKEIIWQAETELN